MNFNLLVHTIQNTHSTLQQTAVKAINKHLTIRNWLIGFYIVEFEQKGEDRAQYGEKLLQRLSDSLQSSSFSYHNLKLLRQFYVTYLQIGQSVIAQLKPFGFNGSSIMQPIAAQLQQSVNQLVAINQKASAQFNPTLQSTPKKLLNRLSCSHLWLLLPIKYFINPVSHLTPICC